MRAKKISLPNLHHASSTAPLKGRVRLGVYDYHELMTLLVSNYLQPPSSKERYGFFDMQDHFVSVRSLKLRTFMHHHLKGDCNCSQPDCNIAPTYFALEKATSDKHKYEHTAYLSLYGVDAQGREVEFTHDHTLARCFGGANSLINTTVMCLPCNGLKSRVESKMHNKTLAVLKAFLEETTGEKADPKFVLERLRKNEYNDLPSQQLEFDRRDVLPLDTVLTAIRDPRANSLAFGGLHLRVDGVRLGAFAQDRQPCCQDPNCQLPATHFAVERVAGKRFKDDEGYFLNMYGSKNGQEVLFQHHHVLTRGTSGVPDSFTVATLCQDCKTKNHDQEMKGHTGMLFDTYQGVTKQQTHEANTSKKEEKIYQVLQLMASNFGMSETDFLKMCEDRGKLLPQKKEKMFKSVRRVKKALNLSNQGARFFRLQQRLLFDPLFDQDERGGMTAEEWDQSMQEYERRRQEAWLEKHDAWLSSLLNHYDMPASQFWDMCKRQTGLFNNLPSTTQPMEHLAEHWGQPVDAIKSFLRHAGSVLKEGPYSGHALPKAFTTWQENPTSEPVGSDATQPPQEPARLANMLHSLVDAVCVYHKVTRAEYVEICKEHALLNPLDEHPKRHSMKKKYLAGGHMDVPVIACVKMFEDLGALFSWGPLGHLREHPQGNLDNGEGSPHVEPQKKSLTASSIGAHTPPSSLTLDNTAKAPALGGVKTRKL